MTKFKDVGTLAEIGAKVGDVVEHDDCGSPIKIVQTEPIYKGTDPSDVVGPLPLAEDEVKWRIISRAAPDYMDGEWHSWSGGECPVPGDVRVEVRFRDGNTRAEIAYRLPSEGSANDYSWDHDYNDYDDITRFRVIRDEPKAGPVQMRPVIVPGVYGKVRLSRSRSLGTVGVELECQYFTHEDLTEIIETLTAVRDALKEQNQ